MEGLAASSLPGQTVGSIAMNASDVDLYLCTALTLIGVAGRAPLGGLEVRERGGVPGGSLPGTARGLGRHAEARQSGLIRSAAAVGVAGAREGGEVEERERRAKGRG